ncbi:MAG: alkaline phosphatase [Phycisphaerae bacterium]
MSPHQPRPTRFRLPHLVQGLLLCLMTSSAVWGADESPSHWFREGRAAVEAARARVPITSKARNVILFVGDGMGISTVTATRIYDGQKKGMKGEENLLSFEKMPYSALIKTYNTNQQVPDSAGTMSAMATGIKTRAGVLSVSQNVERGDHTGVDGNRPTTLLELAERAGLATGIVSTARVTHATPAALYAHSPERNWESDANLSASARAAGFADIARQLIEFPHGDGVDVVFGGGRREFLPATMADPEDADLIGRRKDSRNLVETWTSRPRHRFVWNQRQFDALDSGAKEEKWLGLFESSNMEYEFDRPRDAGGEPSLEAMTTKAIKALQGRGAGFFLMVEGARIDHAHHAGNAYRALEDGIAFADAVEAARNLTDRRDTLIIVTADHSHVFTLGGYPVRGNPILGKVVTNDGRGNARQTEARDKDGKPYTTLTYANGPGFQRGGSRRNLEPVDTTTPDFMQEAAVPLTQESHAGEDVALYAEGPYAHLFTGVLEQHVIFHVICEAFGWSPPPPN